MEIIKLLSYRMIIVLNALIILLPLCVISYWMFYETFHLWINLFYSTLQFEKMTINLLSKTLAMLISFIPTSIILYGLVKLKQLFKNYQSGIIFSKENATLYTQLGSSLFALVIGNVITTPLLALALTFQNGVGERIMMLSLGSNEIIFLITGFIVLIISYVMHEAHHLDLEVKHTI